MHGFHTSVNHKTFHFERTFNTNIFSNLQAYINFCAVFVYRNSEVFDCKILFSIIITKDIYMFPGTFWVPGSAIPYYIDNDEGRDGFVI